MQNKYKEETAKPCPNTILSRKGTIISGETDEERTCLLGGGAGRSGQTAILCVELKQKLPYIPNTYTSTI